MAPFFLFATGIENSYPTIDNGRIRVDQMEASGHYREWRTDFDLVEWLGLEFLRFGPPLHRTWLGPETTSDSISNGSQLGTQTCLTQSVQSSQLDTQTH